MRRFIILAMLAVVIFLGGCEGGGTIFTRTYKQIEQVNQRLERIESLLEKVVE